MYIYTKKKEKVNQTKQKKTKNKSIYNMYGGIVASGCRAHVPN